MQKRLEIATQEKYHETLEDMNKKINSLEKEMSNASFNEESNVPFTSS